MLNEENPNIIESENRKRFSVTLAVVSNNRHATLMWVVYEYQWQQDMSGYIILIIITMQIPLCDNMLGM